MNETDAFFTHTIVGAPLSVPLGTRPSPHWRAAQGLQVDLGQAEPRLSRAWRDWVVTSHACDPVGQPRLRPARWRRWLERHALPIALSGLLSVLGTAVFWGAQGWI